VVGVKEMGKLRKLGKLRAEGDKKEMSNSRFPNNK